MLENEIINAKDKAVMSIWWLAVPVFVIVTLLMKGFYISGSSLISGINDLADRQSDIFLTFFLISPLLLIIYNAASIIKVRSLTENQKSIDFLGAVWFNILIILLSVIIIIVYSL